MRPLLVPLALPSAAYRPLAQALDAEVADLEVRRFPDGESYVRLQSEAAGRTAWVYATLDRPDPKVVQLLFVADTLRDLGATSVGLVAPYLPYLRQDERFHPGEGLTSRYFARLLSRYVDWLVTVDPHLHRHDALGAIYDVPTHTVASAPHVARWLDRFDAPLVLVGPDEESRQWGAAGGRLGDLPYVVFDKDRSGDRDVAVEAADLGEHLGRQPVIIDDIISTGQTMIATARRLAEQGLARPICVGVHALFSDDACRARLGEHMRQVVTCNTIAHPTNAIDVNGGLVDAVRLALAPTWESSVAASTSPLR